MEDGGQVFTYQGGPDVTGFHVPGTGFQQQGGGAGPPSAPQLRAMHHPHHGGNPQIPPQHQQPPPPQAQSQHTGGPPGPAPTSTPPGPSEMGKQGPHMQQGGQMQINFVPNQTRPANSQAFFQSAPRGPTPRMQAHRNQVVNMQPNNVGQQMFSQHMPMQQVPMYGQQVMSTQLHTPQMFAVQSQLPVFGGQPRHQNHAGSGYYQQAGPQQILMPQYSVFPHAAQSTAQFVVNTSGAWRNKEPYYYQSPVGIRPGAAVQGGPGPGGLAGAPSQQVMPGGPPPAQLGQPGAPVPMGIVPGPGVVGVAGLATGDTSAGQTPMTATTTKQTRRKHALDIVDPKTMKNVDIYEANTTSSSTPPHSGESSARDTPQPNTGPSAGMDVAAEFAARVAKAASEKSSPPPPAPVVQAGPPTYVESPPQMVTTNGPDTSGTNNIPMSEGIPPGSILTQGDALPISNQQIVVIEEPSNLAATMAPPTISPVAGTPSWKQGQLPHSTSTSLGSKPSGSISKSDISNQVVIEERVRPSNLEIDPQVVEFVPSVSAADAISPTPMVAVVDTEMTPVVSAQTNAPTVEVIRSTPNREQFPALKNSAMPLSHHSPRRKQQPQSQRPEITPSVPQPAPVSSPPIQTVPLNLSISRETTPVTDIKSSKKAVATEEPTPPSSAFPVPQPPKEKRDQEKQHGRDREKSSSTSSQGRGEREKSTSSTSSSSSQHHGRDREKSSREKDKSNSASQGGPKDRDKSASQGRDRDKSSSKEATPTPSPATPLSPPAVPPIMPQPQPEQPAPVRPVATVEEAKQQTNGEVSAPEATEGKASQHRSKTKQRNQKMRDLNRKGAEKEGGTDMDAFVESPPEEAAPPPPAAVVTPASQPAVQTAPTNKVVDNQIVKEEETEADKEEKLVAARNEENVKVSAAALKEDSSSVTPVIENIPATKPTSLQLKHTYKEDQWSPHNPEGKKKYERDFLMELQNDPQSKKKPDNLPDLEVVLKDSTNRRAVDRSHPNMNRPIPERPSHDTFTPGFMRTPNTRGPLPKRNSQQGNKPNKGNKSNVIHVTLSLEEVKLHESDNAWKPTRMKSLPNTEQDAKSEDLYKKVRGVLNKLTPQKFNTLVTQVQALPIDSSDRLQGVINLVFEKAVDEPNFAVAYAQMCKVLSGMQVPMQNKDERKNKDEPIEYVNFRKLLVNRCQMEFEKNTEEVLNRDAKLKEIEEATDPEKKKELQVNFQEEERRIRMKSVGNIRFIGELFKFGMLTTNIMQRCIKHLLKEEDEESLECLCKLLTTIGKDLENKNQDLTPYFNKMKEISQKRGAVSSRVRFMLQDVIDLRKNKWVPRRDDSNPKTMDQIQKEAEKESLDQQILLNSAPQTPRRQDDRTPQNRKNKGGMDDDGWNKVGTSRGPRQYTVDSAKLRAKEDGSLQQPRLGGNYLFSNWSSGASTKKDINKNPLMGTTMVQQNYFQALSETTSEDSKRPQQLPVSSSRSGPGKATPSPSMEKERMLSLFKTPVEDTRQSRSGASRSSSRENSARRGGDELSSRSYAPSSQPSSIYASSEDISSSGMVPESKNQTLPAAATTVLTTEEVQKKTLTLLEEFLYNTNYKESVNCVIETFPAENLIMFVRESLNDMLERSSNSRQSVGTLMSHLVKDGVITLPMYLTGLNEFLELADDIAIDVPKFWPYIAEFIVPMLLSEVIQFSSLREITHPVHGKLILEVLQLLVKDKGPGWIREKWDAAGLKWTDFLPADKVDDFVKQNKLEYILGGAVSTPSASSSAALNWDHVQKKLEQFLKSEQASTSSFDQICDWIGANVGDRVKEPQFIRALMTAICLSAIESQKTTLKLNEHRFQAQQKLLLRYVDTKEELELQCLYALQSLINQLEHPQGLLCQIFHALWDENTISSESFIAWQNSTDPAEQAGKGVALKSLTTFFTALGEEDSSCEDS